MKKIFFFAATMLAIVSMNAENVFDWTGKVGKIEYVGNVSETTVKVQTNSVEAACIQFENGYTVPEGKEATNYAELTLDKAGFLKGDVINIDFCYNNSQEKVATVAVYTTANKAVVESSNGLNARNANGYTNFKYELTENMDTIRIARGVTGKTKTCITKLEVIRGGVVIDKAGTPVLSVSGGEYFDPFKIGISSSMADKIFISLNDAAYEEYKDSIEIKEYDKEIKLSAFATLDGAENSDTVSATYKLTHFVPRPVFKARTEINLIGITADDIQILSGDNATKATYTMDGKDCPSINYIHKTNGEGTDSVMLISFKDRDGLMLRYKNSSDKANALKVPADYIQCDSKNFEFYVDGVKGGDTIVFVVTAKGSAPKFDHTYSSACYIDPYQPEDDKDPCFTDGEVYTKSDAKVADNYVGWTNLVYIVQEGHTKIRLKETANGCRMAKILIGAYRGEAPQEGLIDGVVATKAVKRIVDGQIIIEKGNRKFNVLGAEIK